MKKTTKTKKLNKKIKNHKVEQKAGIANKMEIQKKNRFQRKLANNRIACEP
jgi:hypothetical protein